MKTKAESKRHALSKKPGIKHYRLYDPFIWNLKRGKTDLWYQKIERSIFGN